MMALSMEFSMTGSAKVSHTTVRAVIHGILSLLLSELVL